LTNYDDVYENFSFSLTNDVSWNYGELTFFFEPYDVLRNDVSGNDGVIFLKSGDGLRNDVSWNYGELTFFFESYDVLRNDVSGNDGVIFLKSGDGLRNDVSWNYGELTFFFEPLIITDRNEFFFFSNNLKAWCLFSCYILCDANEYITTTPNTSLISSTIWPERR
jgi:hypothetical protein